MAKQQLPKLSPTETEIQQRICQLGKASVQEVYESFPAKRKISYPTVQTVLRRLEKKGYLKHRLKGNAYVFTSTVRQDTVINRSISELLGRLFGGDPMLLMQHLAKHRKLSTQDIETLKEMVEKE
jgi:BlaI family penicillinase repressor